MIRSSGLGTRKLLGSSAGRLPLKYSVRVVLIKMTLREFGTCLAVDRRCRSDLHLRTLADSDNRGKLNMAEFHVAMGLIYRRT